jgi:ribonuclease inhibitor
MPKTHDEKYYAFKRVTDNPIILDFSECTTWKMIQDLLKDKFGLPEYYGENWDALWDCLDGLFNKKILIEVHGYNKMSEELKEYCKPMLEVFDDLQESTPDVVFKFIS